MPKRKVRDMEDPKTQELKKKAADSVAANKARWRQTNMDLYNTNSKDDVVAHWNKKFQAFAEEFINSLPDDYINETAAREISMFVTDLERAKDSAVKGLKLADLRKPF